MAKDTMLPTPTVLRDRNNFTFDYDRGAFAIRVVLEDLHHVGADKRASYKITVLVVVPGRPDKTLHHGRLILDDMRGRRETCEALQVSGKTNLDTELLDWYGMLATIPARVAKELKQLPSLVRLDDLDDTETETPWLIKGVLPDRQTTTIFAAGGSLKSLVALTMGLSVQLGIPIGGDGDKPAFVPTRQGNVLYADWETVPQEQARRANQLLRGLYGEERPKAGITYTQGIGPLADCKDALVEIVKNEKIELLIVDSIVPAIRGDINDPDVANPFFAALMDIGCTSLVIAHISKAGREQEPKKNGKEPKRMPFGSAFVEYRSRQVWYVDNLTPEGKGGDGEPNVLMLMSTKANNTHKGARIPITFTWETRPDGIKVCHIGSPDRFGDARYTPTLDGYELVKKALGGGSKSVPELIALTELSDSGVRKALQKLGNQVVAIGTGTGRGNPARYGLSAFQTRALDEPSTLNVVQPGAPARVPEPAGFPE